MLKTSSVYYTKVWVYLMPGELT